MPDQDASPEALTSRAELIEPMGAETLVHARTGTGCDIRVVVPREARVKSGEMLHLKNRCRVRFTYSMPKEGRCGHDRADEYCKFRRPIPPLQAPSRG